MKGSDVTSTTVGSSKHHEGMRVVAPRFRTRHLSTLSFLSSFEISETDGQFGVAEMKQVGLEFFLYSHSVWVTASIIVLLG